jgi:peptide/nickel transport system permease protein
MSQEGKVRLDYVLKRIGFFFIIVWFAATLNFFLPRMSPINPIREKLIKQSVTGGYLQVGIDEMIEVFEKKFGLDQPLWKQYITYISDLTRLDFNYSISNYPRTVISMIGDSIPWTIGLLSITTLLAFVVGSLLGAMLAWPKSPRFIHYLLPPLLTMSAVPYYILGLVLLYVFAFRLRWFPIFGAYSPGTIPDLADPAYWGDVLKHAFLPAMAILLAAMGFNALGMRAMMVTNEGEDYMLFAEAKGLKGRTRFLHYGLRNSLLPQVTALALSLGFILSGSILVEVVFGYPGIGTMLYHAIRETDYYVIQGTVLLIIVSIAFATLLVDLTYPLLDPRITYRRQ